MYMSISWQILSEVEILTTESFRPQSKNPYICQNLRFLVRINVRHRPVFLAFGTVGAKKCWPQFIIFLPCVMVRYLSHNNSGGLMVMLYPYLQLRHVQCTAFFDKSVNCAPKCSHKNMTGIKTVAEDWNWHLKNLIRSYRVSCPETWKTLS